MFNIKIITSLFLIIVSAFIFCFLILQKIFSIPRSNRQHQDSLPSGYRIIWPITRLLVHFFAKNLTRDTREKAHNKLHYGGATFILSAEEFIMSHFAAALSMMIFSGLIFIIIDYNSIFLMIMLTLLGAHLPSSWLHKRINQREKLILKSLPTYLDILTLSMESGFNFTSALTKAIEKSKNCPLKQEFSHVLRDIKSGKTKYFALNGLRTRVKLDAINGFVGSIIQAEKNGSPVGNILRAQADQRRFERFALAEKHGMEAPVKLLAPLVIFIFPTTFIILIFLILVKVYETGILTSPIFHILMSNPVDLFKFYFQ